MGRINPKEEVAISTLLYILSANLDAIGAGLSYGVRKIHISHISLAIIAVILTFCSGLALFTGNILGTFLAPEIGDFLGRGVLFLLGIWIFISSFKSGSEPKKSRSFSVKFLGITVSIMKDPTLCDFNSSSKIEGREVIYLALALSLDAIAIGLGLGIAGVCNWYLPPLIGASHYFFLVIGRLLGTFIANRVNLPHKTWTMLAGICLILLAVFE